jgi:hypothetical protein
MKARQTEFMGFLLRHGFQALNHHPAQLHLVRIAVLFAVPNVFKPCREDSFAAGSLKQPNNRLWAPHQMESRLAHLLHISSHRFYSDAPCVRLSFPSLS